MTRAERSLPVETLLAVGLWNAVVRNAVLRLSIDSRNETDLMLPVPPVQGARKADIEKRIDALMKEVDALRSELEKVKDKAPSDEQPTVDLGKVRVGQKYERAMPLQSLAPQHIGSVLGADSGLVVRESNRVHDDFSETAMLTLSFTPGELGVFKRTFRISLKPGNETLEFKTLEITVVADVIQ
jgi:hypothetical protein